MVFQPRGQRKSEESSIKNRIFENFYGFPGRLRGQAESEESSIKNRPKARKLWFSAMGQDNNQITPFF